VLDGLQFFIHFWDSLGYRIKNHGQIDRTVIMYDYVSHSFDGQPGNLFMFVFEGIGQFAVAFSDLNDPK